MTLRKDDVRYSSIALGIAETTVKTHLHRVFAKTGVGLAMLERSHAHAMDVSFPREPQVCSENVDAAVSQIPYD
ncbi:hypothetical protein XI09_42535 [Bradyrhizobium sp. CCBAU 11386]|nr:hypothetical protein [Bradyrhizobium sp. CCBAU 11386]